MKQTIAVHTDLSWFSKRATGGKYASAKEALAAHIDYILRKEECVYSFNLDKKDWLKRADEYVQKRADSKIAGKKMFVLPRGLSTKEQAQLIKEFLTQNELFSVRVNGKRIRVKLASNDFGFAIHRGRNSVSGEENPHVHILFRPKVKYQNKEYSLHINKTELRQLHQKWENFLRSKGFEIRKNPELGEIHFGPERLRRESGAFSPRMYQAYLRFRLARQYQERLQRQAEIRLPREEAELPMWDELQQEVPTRGERVFQERVSVQKSTSPKPKVKPKPQKPVKFGISFSGQKPPEGYLSTAGLLRAKDDADRELLRFLRELEAEVEQKKREEEARQRREAETLEESLKQQVIYIPPDWDDDDFPPIPGL